MEHEHTKEKGLLEVILEATGYEFLSDLHTLTPSAGNRILGIIPYLNQNRYSLAEWTDSVCYITGEKADFITIAEAADYLKCYITAQNSSPAWRV